MREFDDEIRAAGPPLVWQGPGGGPIVLVLDPAGEAKHDELPATWRPLAEHIRVGWCRLPADARYGKTVEDVLRGLDHRAHLVAAGSAARHALRLAWEHAALVRSVIAVDPAPAGETAPPADVYTAIADWWNTETEPLRRELTARDIRVVCFVSRAGDPAVRVEPPVPLGHPDVVARVVQTLLSFQGEGHREPVEPQRRAEIAASWRAVRKRFGPALQRARRG
ncbi:hypothetical protein ABZ863_03050 [Saccharomonospora sp. NPDC046836]|uniref:hypothetical protein n=1 Tax=Saccharomonospora sp. NPDC046836 TaxID=3156921 RepID=UPI0033F7E38D